MSTLHITVGMPASGKSSWAKYRADDLIDQLPIVSTDEIRERITGDASDQSKNGEVFGMAHELVAYYLDNDQSCIYDATNLTPAQRLSVQSIATMRPQVSYVMAHRFYIPFRVAMKRNAKRERKVPSQVMARMYAAFRDYSSSNQLAAEGWNVIDHDWQRPLLVRS